MRLVYKTDILQLILTIQVTDNITNRIYLFLFIYNDFSFFYESN